MPLLLVYGAAFVAGGFALALQARAASGAQGLPRIALGLLAGFALVHGASEWAAMAIAIRSRLQQPVSQPLAAAALALLALSFALLFAFGAALLVGRERRALHILAAGLAPATLGAILVARYLGTGIAEASGREAAEVMVRYVLGVPACVSAAAGLLALRARLPAEERPTLQYVAIAAGVFLSYGVLAGVIVPRAPFLPASVVNAGAFRENVHLPIEVLRAACAIAIVLLVSEAFVIEPSHRARRELAFVRTEIRTLLAVEARDRLSAIEQGTTALEALSPDASGRARGLLQGIREAARLVRDRIGEVIDASDVGARQLSVAPRPVDLRPLLRVAAEDAARSASGRAQVRVECPDQLSPALADPARVEQVLRTLLAQACRHASPHGDVRVAATQGRGDVAVSVTSRGEGLPTSELRHVFSRAGPPRRGAGGAAALRLHLARGLVEAMGGRVSVESVRGEHVTFRFTLPLAS